MKKKLIIKEKETKNKYGITTRFELAKWYNTTKSGVEYSIEYIVQERMIDTTGKDCGGYFRIYKRLANAMKDSIVERYVESEE